MAGLIKVALSVRHGLIPPSLHFQSPNPHIRFDDLRLRVQTKLGPWPNEDDPPLAGVSSFGFGGTNCHVVGSGLAESRARLVTVKADSDTDLAARARAIVEHLDHLRLGDAGDSANGLTSGQFGIGDSAGDVRAAAVFSTPQDLRRKLIGIAEGV